MPLEARNDYFYKNVDAAGTEARMRIDGLPAGVYNITVFEGRTTDAGQVAKIWGAGDTEPESENTGGFAGGGATVAVTLGAGDSLWYKHLGVCTKENLRHPMSPRQSRLLRQSHPYFHFQALCLLLPRFWLLGQHQWFDLQKQ